MNDSERIESISVEKALEHSTMRAIVRDFSPDKHNMMILAEEVKRLRRVLANEVKRHVDKIDALKVAEAALAQARAELKSTHDCAQEQAAFLRSRLASMEAAATKLLAEMGADVAGKIDAPQLGRIGNAIVALKDALRQQAKGEK